MSEEPGYLLYKCRLCGQVEKNPHAPDCITALMVCMGIVEIPSSWFGPKPAMIDIHHCDTGRTGIADLIGFERDEYAQEKY